MISYNVLADIYADQDFSRDVLYSYCPPYALAIDYRKHLLVKELQGKFCFSFVVKLSHEYKVEKEKSIYIVEKEKNVS